MLFEVPGYQLTGKLSEDATCRIYRGERIQDGRAVRLKVLNQANPAPKALGHFCRQYEILKVLDLPGVEKAYSLEHYQTWWIIVLEEFGGQPLSKLEVAGRLKPGELLDLATQLTETIGQIHARRIIHRNIAPSTVLLNPITHQAKLSNFADASLVSQEKVPLQISSDVAESLPYISPEMTGRTNRPVDYRTDYYSLGATLYELLTGTPPFLATSPLQLFHAHLAVLPDAPSGRIRPWRASPAAFGVLSAIILKLLSKNPEDRYQSPEALQADLRRCLATLRQGSAEGLSELSFTPGQADHSNNLNIPHTVIGREPELQVLNQAFLRTIGGPTELVLVSGAPGIGKTTLVHQLMGPVTEHKGLFLQAKYDQIHQREPYAAVAALLEQFCILVLSEPGPSFLEWRKRIQSAVWPHGQLLIGLCPRLEQVIGPQPEVEAVDEELARRRFHNLVIRFLQTMCHPERPVVIFLDDLQWSTWDSLLVWESILPTGAIPNLLIVGAYRNNEGADTKRVQRWVEEIREARGRISHIELQNLEPASVEHLVAAALASKPQEVSELARLVYERTRGNPYFSNELLRSLYRHQLLAFSPSEQRWNWDAGRIEEYRAAGNILDLLVHEIAWLDPDTQRTLQYAACLGRRFDAGDLLEVIGKDRSLSLSYNLWRAMTEGWIYALDENYRLLAGEIADSFDAETGEPFPRLVDLLEQDIYFEFQHNNVQQAILATMDAEQLSRTHLLIGLRLLEKTERAGRELLPEDIFSIVDHLNAGQAKREDSTQAIQIAQLNLRAAHEARAMAAFEVSSSYLSAGIQSLPPDSWNENYELTYDLYAAAAEAAMLGGDLTRAETLTSLAEPKAETLQDKARLTKVRMDMLQMQSQQDKAVELGIELIRSSGFDLEAGELPNIDPEQILQLPDMTDPMALILSELADVLISAPFARSDPRLPALVRFYLDLFTRYGNPPNAPFVYSCYAAMMLMRFQHVDQFCEVGRKALELAERRGASASLYAVRHVYFAFLHHWQDISRDALPLLQRNAQLAFDSGSLQYSMNSKDLELQNSFLTGIRLEELRQKQAAALQQLGAPELSSFTQRMRLWAQVVLKLAGDHPRPEEITGELFSSEEARSLVETGQMRIYVFNIFVAQSYLSLLFHDHQRALDAATTANAQFSNAWAQLILPYHYFVYSLALLAGELDPSDLSARLERVEENLRLMRQWAALVPQNFLHQLELVQAEQARCLGLEQEAAASYERAIQNAMKYGYIQDAALAAELAARYYLERGDESQAKEYLLTAFEAYDTWGAKAKTAELMSRHPQWLAAALQRGKHVHLYAAGPARSTERSAPSMDLDSILKASLELSQETNLEELLRTLMSILIENAGAQNGSLVLWRDANWYLEVQDSTKEGRDFAVVSTPLQDQAGTNGMDLLPAAIIHYVINTRAPLVLPDASESAWFAQDAYIRARLPKSILCAPLMNQGVLTGVVYLENNVTAGAFTSERLEMVQLISSQAAVSIEKARLYENLEAQVEARTRQLSEANKRLEAEIHGRILVEEALRLSEEQYRAVFENTGTAMAIIDTDGYMVLANEEMAALTGYSRRQLEDHFLALNLVAPPDRSMILQYRDARVRDPSQPPHSYEFQMVDRSGARKTVLNTVAVLPGSKGLALSWIDISQRKAAEEALRDSEALLRKVLDILPVGVWILDKTATITSGNPEVQRIWGGVKYVGKESPAYKAWRADSGEIVTGEDWAGVKAVDQRKTILNEELQIEAFDGTRRTILHSAIPLTAGEDQAPSGAIVVNQDITELKHHEQEIQKANDRLSTLLEISERILSVLDQDELLNFILDQLERIVPYEGAAIVNVDQDDLTPQVMRPPALLQASPTSNMPTDQSDMVKRFLTERQAIYIPDMQAEGNILSKMRQIWKLPEAEFVAFRTWFSVPLIAKDNLVGILVLLHSQPDHYPPEIRSLTQAYASQIAIAIENARLYKQSGESAALKERNRLARELHDSVAQALYSMSLFTDATRKALNANKLDVVKGNVDELAVLAREALSDMRLLIYELRPPILEQAGLAAALQSRLEAVETRAGFHAQFHTEGEIQLTPEQEGELYRIAQEALSNVIKHAHATQVTIELVRDKDCIQLTIQDDGVGFDVATAEAQGGQGFRSIRERATRIGATHWFESVPGQGTKLVVEVNV
ncbi:MAG TPA: GAF domain-containing protein [Anaerolineales bacterium]|nr:GAF domain-containing protein [Anaerolineales bacterium]